MGAHVTAMKRDEHEGLYGQQYPDGRVEPPDPEPISAGLAGAMVAGILLGVLMVVGSCVRAHGQDPITAMLGPPTKADPVRAARVELGRMLYHDRRVGDGTTSCADCHIISKGGSDGRKLAVGRIDSRGFPQGRVGTRHTPHNLNLGFHANNSKFWDGRARDLVEQALGPIANPDEMANQTPEQMANRLNRDVRGYAPLVQAAFGSPELTANRFAVAVAQFQTDVLKATDTPLTRYLDGDQSALSETAKRGAKVFQAHCAVCHPKPIYTTGLAANTGVETLADTGDLGVEKTTGNRANRRAFKIPGLVAVTLRAPYGHNGSVATLERMVQHYAAGGSFMVGGQVVRDRFIDSRVASIKLSATEQADLLAVLVEGLVPYDMPRAEDVVPKELPR